VRRRRQEQGLAKVASSLSTSLADLRKSARELLVVGLDVGAEGQARDFSAESLPVRLKVSRNDLERHTDGRWYVNGARGEAASSPLLLDGIVMDYEAQCLKVVLDVRDDDDPFPKIVFVREEAAEILTVAEDVIVRAHAPWWRTISFSFLPRALGLHEAWVRHFARMGLQPAALNLSPGIAGDLSWFALRAPPARSGAGFVRGTAKLRFLWHKRGQVIRGLDEALQRLSLGSRAAVTLRHDFGLGDSIVMPQLEERTRVTYDVEILSIGNKTGFAHRWRERIARVRKSLRKGLHAWLSFLRRRCALYFLQRFVDSLARDGADQEEHRKPVILDDFGKLVRMQDGILLELQRRRVLRQMQAGQ